MVSSQQKRDPMLLFEFDAALFQFEQREPELDVLFQLPPRIAALYPIYPLLCLILIHAPIIFPTSAINTCDV